MRKGPLTMRVDPYRRADLRAKVPPARFKLTAMRRQARRLRDMRDLGPRGPQRRRLGIWLAAAAAAVAALAIAALTLWMPLVQALAGAPPPPRTLPADTLVTAADGTPIADVHEPGMNRVPVSLDRVSPLFRQAIVAVEDHAFWSEGAVDAGRVAAAAWSDLRSGSSTQGASTIPMQLAKVLYLSDNRSLMYKVREIAYANDLMAGMSKSEILDAYINDIPFGEGATGVEAAAEIYFGLHASQLDLAQASLLAGLPQAPGAYDPRTNLQAAKDRQLQVLQAMQRNGDITAAQAATAANEPLHFESGDVGSYDLYPAFVNRVVEEVQSTLHLDPATAGLHIETTLDPALQGLAQSTVSQQIRGLHDRNVTDGALVSIDPTTGDVLAYVGNAGPSVPGADYDMASVPRQMGSSFKLFTYPTAIGERKATMLTPVLDGPISIPLGNGQTYQPKDYDLSWHGIVPLELALGNSLNVPAIRVELLAGIPNVVDTARSMGVTTLTKPASSYGPSLTLGTYPVPLWEMAQAATAYANQGILRPAQFITKVTDSVGRVLYRAPARGRQVLDPGVAFIMNQILSNDANRVMEFGAHSDLTLDGHVVAAKTGTTQDFRDNITVGWTPHLVTATWVGNANDSPMQGTTGLTGAAPIWHDFMTKALQGVSDNWPSAPSDVVQETVGQPIPSAGQPTAAPSPSAGTSTGATNVRYSGDCRYWTYQGANYWYCGGDMSGLPGDPGPNASGVGQTGGDEPPIPAGLTPGMTGWFLTGTDWTTGAQQLTGIAPGTQPGPGPASGAGPGPGPGDHKKHHDH
jgi:membrane peptidoglycan carboxypeptidase